MLLRRYVSILEAAVELFYENEEIFRSKPYTKS